MRAARSTVRRALVAALCFAPVLVAVAPQASAAVSRDVSGSVVFVRSHNVYLARPDGTHVRQLTRNGGYSYPSEDNRGHVVAIRGKALYRLDQHGHVLQHFTAPTTGVNLGLDFASVSPDGTKIAYSWTTMIQRSGTTYYRDVLGYTSATRSHRLGHGASQNIAWGTWVNNTRMVVGSEDNDVYYKDVGRAAHLWYSDCDATGNCGDGGLLYNNFYPAVNRQGTVFASAIVDTGYNHTAPWPTLFNLLDTGRFGAGTPPARPTHRCSRSMATPTSATQPGQRDSSLQSPSFSPRGSSLVFGAKVNGSWAVVRVDGVSDVAACSFQTSLILRNASQPRWSPAPLR